MNESNKQSRGRLALRLGCLLTIGGGVLATISFFVLESLSAALTLEYLKGVKNMEGGAIPFQGMAEQVDQYSRMAILPTIGLYAGGLGFLVGVIFLIVWVAKRGEGPVASSGGG